MQHYHIKYAMPFIAICIFLGTFGSVCGQSNVYGTDGPVYATVQSGNTIYLGGSFNLVGANVAFGTTVDASTGTASLTTAKPNGTVLATVPDGLGGWYIGGDFTQVAGQPRNRLAQINGSGVLTSWNPDANNTVRTLVLAGNTVYAGGLFTTVGGTTARNRLAAFDATSGTVMSWNPDANNEVYALAVSGSTVYAGGMFTTVNGSAVPRNRLAAFDAVSGVVASWDPNMNNSVQTLAVSGTTVYAGGNFSSAGGGTIVRNRLAAFNATTGVVTAFDPNVNSTVYALAVSGNTLYAGGGFSTVGGSTTRNRLASFNATSGAATSWNPTTTISVFALALSGNTVYIGGYANVFTPDTRKALAAFDATTAATTPWNPGANSTVRALAITGNTVYVGGIFTIINAVMRNSLAAVDATTGMANSWNPLSNGEVDALEVLGNTVYAGGYFNVNIGGSYSYRRLAAIDATTGVGLPWTPPIYNGYVKALATLGNTLYVGGTFYNDPFDGTTRNALAAFDASTRALSSWNPNPPPNPYGGVFALEAAGSTVYAGGYFTAVGATGRNHLAAIDAVSGAATSWNPAPNDQVHSLALSGNTLYAGGDFSTCGGSTVRNRLAAFDATAGTLLPWDPDANSTVRALAVSGGTVYAGGDFSNVAGGLEIRNRLAAFDAASGAVTAWNPDANLTVYTLAATSTAIYAGGGFTLIQGGSVPASRFVALDPFNNGSPLSLSISSFTGQAVGQTNVLAWQTMGEATGTTYTVECSADGAAFHELGIVTGNGSGSYRFTDKNAKAGRTAYYRLRVTGAGGGSEAYSAIVTIRRSAHGLAGGTVTLAPQPAQGILNISTDETLVGRQATILDMQGRKIAHFSLSLHTTLDVSGWAPGHYALRLQSGEVLRVVKQ